MESRRGYRDYGKNSNWTDTMNSQSPQSSSTPPTSINNTFTLNSKTIAAQNYTYGELFDTSWIPQPGMEVQLSTEDFMPSPESSGSTASITNDQSPSQPTESLKKESSDLIDVFYKHFHPSHPFVVPKKLYNSRTCLLPEYLKAAMRFVAGHYVPNANIKALRNAASVVLLDKIPEDGFKVQGLLLFAVASFARYEQSQGARALELAIQVALRIGMNGHMYAFTQGQNNFTLQESWRRTWWSLFITNGLVTAIGGQEQPFRLHDVYSDIPLPGSCEDYDKCQSTPQPRGISDFRNRTFSEDSYCWSSFAYAIEAMYIMGAVFSLGADSFAITDPQVEAIDASISNFLLSLPPSKRDVTSPNGHTDEILLVAHMIINWAAILIHRPRSSLTFIRNHYHTTCTSRREAAGLPALAYASHTAKTLRAANALISLASIPRPLSYCTPIMMCGITTAATVHLPAYALADRHDTAVAIKERLQLCISALGAFAEIWPRANIAKSQVAGFAREVLTKPSVSVDSTGVGMVPVVTASSSPDLIAASIPLPQVEYGMSYNENTWMDSIIQMDKDELDSNQCLTAAGVVGRPTSAGGESGRGGPGAGANMFALMV